MKIKMAAIICIHQYLVTSYPETYMTYSQLTLKRNIHHVELLQTQVINMQHDIPIIKTLCG